MFVKSKSIHPNKNLGSQQSQIPKKPKMVETISIHMLKDLKKSSSRNFEIDSGISIDYIDCQQFQVIEFCSDRILVHLFDQILIYDITLDFELILLKNV